MSEEKLFCGSDLHKTLNKKLKEIKTTIKKNKINADIDIEALADQLMIKNNIIIPELIENEIYQVRPEEIELPLENTSEKLELARSTKGFKYTIVVPFQGDGKLLKCKPSQYSNYKCNGTVKLNRILFEYYLPHDVHEDWVERQFKMDLEKLRKPLFHMAMVIDNFRDKLINMIRQLSASDKDLAMAG